MITPNRHYPLPNKNHDVVDDINDLRSTFDMIDDDVTNTEEEIEELSETVSDLENRAVHLPYSVENSEIQNISANRYLVVNSSGDGFECLDGGGDAGGISGQCSIKKTDSNFDTAWGNILEISKNGMTPQENSETSQSNESHIYVDEAEIENDEQLPKVELMNCQAKSDLESVNNESVIFCDNAEEIEDEIQTATHENFGLVKVGSGFTNNAGTISAPIITKATEDNFGIIKTGEGLVNNNGIISRDGAIRDSNMRHSCSFGAVKFRPLRYRGESVFHMERIWQPALCKHGIKGGNAELDGKSLRTELDMVTKEKSVYELSLEISREMSWYACNEAQRKSGCYFDQIDTSQPPADSRDLSSTRNGTMERSNRYKSSREIEKAASRKPYNGGIVQEANACGNAQDMQTWTL